MSRIYVDLKDRGYDIVIEPDSLDKLGGLLKPLKPGSKLAVVTDDQVSALYAQRAVKSLTQAGFEVYLLSLPHGEQTKSIYYLTQIYNFLCQYELSRTDGIVALGGGVIGDLAGLAAATYLRGIHLYQVPTSLLAQVDASIGGKTAVDLPQGKNLVGCFYQPRLVVVDPKLLQTLPDEIWRDGMGEVIKYACIRDKAMFESLMGMAGRTPAQAQAPALIKACLQIKAGMVMNDEKDTGERMLLNFGHTLGHAIETVQGFTGIRHGEAVGVGMALITRLSEQKGFTKPGTYELVCKCLTAHGLEHTLTLSQPQKLREAMARDKKWLSGSLNVVLLKEIGQSFLQEVDLTFFEEVAPWLQ